MRSCFPDDLYEPALRAIAPVQERKPECRNALATFVALLAEQAAQPKSPSPAELRGKLINLEAHLKGARGVLSDLGPSLPKASLGTGSASDRITMLEAWIQALQPFVGDGYGIIVERHRPRPSHLAYLACEGAHTFLADYSQHPAPVRKRAVIDLADALLAAAGINGVAVDRAAQHVVRRRRELEVLNLQRRTAEK